MPFAENLKYLKSTLGLTNYRFAKEIGCSQTAVKNWIDGDNLPHEKTRIKIAEHFGLTLEEMDGDKLPEPNVGIKKDLPHGEVDEKTQKMLDFWDTGTPEEIDDVLEYIEFIKSKRKK